jgi:hypothetical protein
MANNHFKVNVIFPMALGSSDRTEQPGETPGCVSRRRERRHLHVSPRRRSLPHKTQPTTEPAAYTRDGSGLRQMKRYGFFCPQNIAPKKRTQPSRRVPSARRSPTDWRRAAGAAIWEVRSVANMVCSVWRMERGAHALSEISPKLV